MSIRALRLPLRFDVSVLKHEVSALRSAVDMPLEKGSSVAIVLRTFACPVRSVRLLRLAPGAAIREHRDAGPQSAEGTARLHVPVVTHPGVDFVVDGLRAVMEPGECWYVDPDRPHFLNNRSATERVDLVIDCVVNPWLRDVFARATAPESRIAPGTAEFAAFRIAVLDDVLLQAQLRDLSAPDAFARRCTEVGAQAGFQFGIEDVRAAMRTGRTAWLQRKLAGLA